MKPDNFEAMSKLRTRLGLPALACALMIGLAVGTEQQNLESDGGASSAGRPIQRDAFTEAVLIGETDCPMISQPVPDWSETLKGSATPKRVSSGFYPGTQGLAGSAEGTALISLHSTEKQTVRRHDLRSNSISDILEVDINAAGVTRLDGDASGTPVFVVANYNQPTVTLIDANFTSVRTLKLPNVFHSLVGIATIRGDFAVCRHALTVWQGFCRRETLHPCGSCLSNLMTVSFPVPYLTV